MPDLTSALFISIGLVIVFVVFFIATRFKRCPSNKILVIYGKVGAGKSAQCIHGGGKFILPLIQDYEFLDLAPRTIEIDLNGALSKKNIRVNVPSTFTVGISTQGPIMQNAAERLLGLNETAVRNQCQDIILGQMRLVIATLSIEEINQDREKFLELVHINVGTELQKIGLEVINVNIRDITDESKYIEAIGKKAAAEAVNQARIEVAEAEKMGAVGESLAVRHKEVRVAEESSESIQGQKAAERDQRVAVSQLEATAVGGENQAKAEIALVNADLAEKEATARRRAQVANAEASQAILEAEKQQEAARLSKEQIAQEEITRDRMVIAAEAQAEQIRRVAAGEADRIRSLRNAEAEGERSVLEAKAEGYRALIAACDGNTELAPSLLMIEKITEVVAEQVKAIQNLKIDKITVWDGGRASGEGGGTTANFLSGLMGSLPAMHDLAKQAGIELPSILGRVPSTEEDGQPEAIES